jgi:Zn-dependent protease with chaperone function
MTTLVLALLALVLAGPVPWLLARMPRLRRTPRAAMTLWQAVALAAVLAALGAGFSLATIHGLGPVGSRSTASYVVAVVALLVTLTVLGRLLLTGHLVGTRLRALRRRHRELVDVLSADESPLGARVLPVAEAPMAWCLPGVRRSRIVLTEAAVERLREDELAAVLAHERAHLRARHDLVLEAFTVLHRAFPRVLSSRRALDEVRLLVEVLADRSARQRVGARPLVSALSRLVGEGLPEAALGAAGTGVSTEAGTGTLRARLDVLLDEESHPVQAGVLYALAIAVLALPTLLVVVPWLSSLR